jgi:hypothetical protein
MIYSERETKRTIEKIEKAIDAAALPKAVLRVPFELYTDSAGDPAIRLYVIIDDAVIGTKSFDHRPINQSLFDALLEAETGRWPYIYFRSESEQKEIEDEAKGLVRLR